MNLKLRKLMSINSLFTVCLLALICLSCNNATEKAKSEPNPAISEAKDAYCWLSMASSEMYASPDNNSSKLWKFSQGEVLEVIGSKSIKNTPWLQVKFTGNVKAGYEEILTITTKPESEKLAGWIQGTVEQLVRCK